MMSEYDIVVEKLKKKADAKYKAFNDRIVVSGYETIGVRIPDVKKIAKEIDKKKIGEYLSECKFAYYEDVLIYGFLIAGLPFDEFWQKKDLYLSKCDSWGQIDCFVPMLKIPKDRQEEFYNLCMNGIETQTDFALRFRIVALMSFFVGTEHTEEILKTVEKLDGKGYYNDMAIAWLISVAFIKKRDITLRFLKKDKLSVFTHNKAISKINDSYRVDESDKKYLKTLRK